MDILIEKENGPSYKLSDYGITVKDVIIESIEIEDSYEDKENSHGRLLLSSQYRKRKITVPAFFVVSKLNDVPRLRDLLYELVSDTGYIYLREIRRKKPKRYRFIQPTKDDYQRYDEFEQPIYEETPENWEWYVSGKRYQVKCIGAISPDQKGKKVTFDIEFETVELPFAESIGTSLDLENNPNKELWSYDMAIPFDESDDMHTYTFENTTGNSVYYHGNIPNNQFNLYKKVTIILGKDTKNFQWNMTESDIMTIEGINLKKGDKIVYDGVQTFRNGTPINDESSLAQPKFRSGWNNFEFNQAVRSIVFDMKFYYK